MASGAGMATHEARHRHRWLRCVCLTAALLLATTYSAAAAVGEPEDAWISLAREIFKGRPLADGGGIVGIEMPSRAEDAAVVPVTMRVTLPRGDTRRLQALTLVIDENPAPVAATFKLGDNSGVSVISTRVRVNSYTNVHVVAELSDGNLYVAGTYVKASGGCSAPAARSSDEALASLGRIDLVAFGKLSNVPASIPREAQVSIRHPNNSGLQRDQVSLLYIPAQFVDELKVWQGEALLLSIEAGISISEDPQFRFSYVPDGSATFRVEAKDTDGKVFRREWKASEM